MVKSFNNIIRLSTFDYRLSTIIFCLLCALCSLRAEQCPKGYYDRIDGASDSILKGRLKAIIRNHTVIEYGDGSWEVFYYADRDSSGYCVDMYCDNWKKFGSPGSAVSGCNVEHSFAKSWWGGAKNDAYKDCYHLNPSNSTANSSRSNYPPGIPLKDFKEQSKTGSMRVGKRHHDALNEDYYVFEPKDEYKGDFARTYFYMATCYGRDSLGNIDKSICSAYNGWRLDNKDVGSRYGMQNNDYLEFQPWLVEVLLDWHRKDPVSQKELKRMDAVSNFQHNRNPFIEYPCLVEYIWGNRKGQKVQLDSLLMTTAIDWLSLKDSMALTGCLCDTTPLPPPMPKDTFMVSWLVDNQKYTAGDPTTAVADGEKITQLPTNPESCSSTSETFIGWTITPFSVTDQCPEVLYTKASSMPAITQDQTYHAVFAHHTQTGGGADVVQTVTPTSSTGWTINAGSKSTAAYWVLSSGKSITSPEIDIASLKKILISIRTYGGTSYKTVNVHWSDSTICSMSGTSSTIHDYTWTNSTSLMGKGKLTFASNTTSSDNGPGVSQIELTLSGVIHSYSAYTTSCASTDITPITHHLSPITKFLKDGHLFININGVTYNINGQLVQ